MMIMRDLQYVHNINTKNWINYFYLSGRNHFEKKNCIQNTPCLKKQTDSFIYLLSLLILLKRTARKYNRSFSFTGYQILSVAKNNQKFLTQFI